MMKKLFHNPIALGLLVVTLFVTSEVFGLTQVGLTLRTNQEITQNLLHHATFDAIGDGLQGGLDGWSTRVPITISSASVTSTLTSFPVYVDLSDLPSSFFDTVKSDGSDIRVTKSDGTSEVAFELVAIDTSGAPSCASSCTGELHFLADSISSSSDTLFYIYYGNASAAAYGATDTYGSEAVWANYYAVFHLNEAVNTTSGGYINSAGGGDGTGVSMAQTAVSGALGGGQAQDFTGGDYISFTESLVSENTVTMSAWIYPDTSQGAYVGILESRDSGLKGLLDSGGGVDELTTAWDGDGAEFNLDTNLNWSVGSWQYVAGVVASTTIDTYLNGASYTQIGSNALESASNWYIGTDPNFIPSRSWEGYLDEVRIAKDALSDDWVQAEYLNQSNPSGFYTVGSEDSGNPIPIAQAAPGRLGQAALFDGVDDSIDLGDLNGTVKTIAFWIKASDTTTQKIIDIDGTDHIELNASSQINPVSFPGTTATYIDGESGSAISTGWHHVVITDTTGVDASAVVLGEVGGTFFDGTLDDVRFYTAVLSASAIQRLYELGATTKVSTSIKTNSALDNGLISHWTFDGVDGIDNSQVASVRDRIGSNHGTPYIMGTQWKVGWDYRVPITINSGQVSSTLADFPVYVDLSDMPAAFFTNVQGDGDDIRIVEADGLTETPFELVSISTSTSAGELYFKADEISDVADTTFYMYYGNAGAFGYAITDTYGAQNVWVGYDMVHHLEDAVADSTSGGVLDSTSNSQDGTPTNFSDGGGGATGVSGKLGNAADFAGDDDQISLGSFTPGSAGTVSMWFNLNTINKNHRPYGGDDRYEFRFTSAGDVFSDMLVTGGAGPQAATIGSTGVWYYLATTYDDAINTTKAFLDGALINTKTDANAAMGGPYTTYLGRSATAQYFDGLIDELRVSDSVRSDAWIETEYNNMSSPGTFYTIGTPTSLGTGSAYENLVSGRMGQALEFSTFDFVNAVNENPIVNIGTDTSLDLAFPFTISAWMHLNDFYTASGGMVIGKGSEDDDSVQWALFIQQNGVPYFIKVRNDKTTTDAAFATSAIDENEWGHYIFTIDASGNWVFYFNGQEDATGTFSNSEIVTTSDPGYIGAYYRSYAANNINSGFWGQLDDVRLYDRALSAEEARRLYGLGGTTHVGVTAKPASSSLETDLVSHYTFDGVTGIDPGQTYEVRDEEGSNHADMSSITVSDVGPGAVGQALVFDGSADFLLADHDATLSFGSGDSISLGAFVRPDAVASTYAVLAKTDFAGINLNMNYSLRIDNGKLAFTYRDTGGDFVSYQSDAAVITAGDWQHVGFTYTFGTGSTAALYVNGEEVAGSWLNSETGNDAPTEPSVGLQIGSRNTGEFFDGSLDDIRIYSRALSANEMLRLATTGQ